MKIYFVRHGHPNYEKNCLTELGHKQAKKAAEILKNSGITQVFSSPYGRTLETAEYTAKALGLKIHICEFIKEILWGSIDGEPLLAHGHPWMVSRVFVEEGKTLLDTEWRQKEPYSRSKILESVDTVEQGLDGWLAQFGYQREGEYYRVVGENTDKTVAVFSHGGSSGIALSHLLNIPFPQFCGIFRLDYTSITVVELSNKVGELCFPQVVVMNDARHIEGLETENVYKE